MALAARGRDALDAEAATIGAAASPYPCDMSLREEVGRYGIGVSLGRPSEVNPALAVGKA